MKLVRDPRTIVTSLLSKRGTSLPQSHSIALNRVWMHTTASCTAKKKDEKELSPEPIKFTTSAANIRAMPKPPVNVNPYQPFSVMISLGVFLLYFLYLREENDLDAEMGTHLFERIPNLEEPTIRQAIPQMRDAGMDTSEAEARLKVLIQERKAREAQGLK